MMAGETYPRILKREEIVVPGDVPEHLHEAYIQGVLDGQRAGLIARAKFDGMKSMGFFQDSGDVPDFGIGPIKTTMKKVEH